MLKGELSTLLDSLDSSMKRNHLYCCFILGNLEPWAVRLVFAFASVWSPLSVASAWMPTTFTLVIKILMKMGMSFQTCLGETMNHSNRFYLTKFMATLIFQEVGK